MNNHILIKWQKLKQVQIRQLNQVIQKLNDHVFILKVNHLKKQRLLLHLNRTIY
jgi:hypothetical protein